MRRVFRALLCALPLLAAGCNDASGPSDPDLTQVTFASTLGVKPGVTLNPATSVDTIAEILPYVDLVLVMSVNPGFGGQSYIPTSTDKIRRIRRMLDERGLDHVELQVDGGVAPDTVGEVVGAGATCFVAGSAVYNARASVAENVRRLREAVEAAGGRGRP